jgi:hypothetical protein
MTFPARAGAIAARPVLGLAILMVSIAGVLPGTPREVAGQEFRVSPETLTAYPRVAATADGRFLVIWMTGEYEVYGRWYSADGASLGEPYWVAEGERTAIAMDAAGRHVIAWESEGGIRARRWSGAGEPLGAEFFVSSPGEWAEGGRDVGPAVATNDSGAFVIAWKYFIFDGDPGNRFYAQRFDESGSPAGEAFEVSEYRGIHESPPAAAMGDDGRFIIAWHGDSVFSEQVHGYSIFAQRYGPLSEKVGEPFLVHADSPGHRWQEAVAVDRRGVWTFAWTGTTIGADDDEIFARRFDAEGNPLGDEIRVNTYWKDAQEILGLAVDRDSGETVIAWECWYRNDIYSDVYAQRFDPDGARVGSEIRLNTIRERGQLEPRLGLASGKILAAWISEDFRASLAEVYAKVLDFHGVEFVRGDSNGDGEVDISDAVATLLHLFRGRPQACADAADANDDGALDVTDAVFTLDYLFRGGTAPAFPGPEAGLDDTADTLACAWSGA